jgi:hypothetical protein
LHPHWFRRSFYASPEVQKLPSFLAASAPFQQSKIKRSGLASVEEARTRSVYVSEIYLLSGYMEAGTPLPLNYMSDWRQSKLKKDCCAVCEPHTLEA